MHETERRLRTMINPWSSAFTRWWCHSTARYILTGYGRGSGRVLHGARVLPLSNHVSNYRPRQWHTPVDHISQLRDGTRKQVRSIKFPDTEEITDSNPVWTTKVKSQVSSHATRTQLSHYDAQLCARAATCPRLV
jgi:hypothetical protein